MNLSKLQSEAVNKINPNIAIQKVAYAMALARDRAFKAGEIKDGKTTDEWKEYRKAKVKLSQTIADQIQKAYSNGREEVVKEFDKQWADLGVGGKHPPWHVWIENCQLRCLQGTHLDRKKLSIQSKGR